jgi:hypothetical protein
MLPLAPADLGSPDEGGGTIYVLIEIAVTGNADKAIIYPQFITVLALS